MEFEVASYTHMPSSRVAINNISLQGKGNGQLMMEMSGLEVKSLGNDDDDASGRSLFFRTRWLPAFDLIESERSVPAIGNMPELIDLFAHQYPNSQILHLNSSIEKTEEVLTYLGGARGERRRFGALHVHSSTKDVTEDFVELAGSRAGLVEVVEPKEEEYDLVIASEENEDPSAFLKQGGILITDGQSPSNSHRLTQLFSTKEFAIDRKDQQSETVDDLTIVMPSAIRDRTTALSNAIQSACNLKANLTTLADITAEKKLPKNVAILSTLEEPVEDEKSYLGLQRLFTDSDEHNMILLTSSAVMESESPESAMALGLARVARSENEALRLVTLDISQELAPETAASHTLRLLDSELQEDEFAERNGILYIPKVEADDTLNGKLRNGFGAAPKPTVLGEAEQPLILSIGKVGLLDSLHFRVDEEIVDNELGEDEVEIDVKASAINFRDVAAAMGIIDDYVLGDECAGVVKRVGSSVDKAAFDVGDRVVAWRPGHGAHRTTVRNPSSLCYKLQGDMGFGEAAALPLILTTAYFSLIDTARLQKGETVLIHAAAGGVGQMAVQLAQMVGANVIATCGSQAKRDLLKEKFGLQDNQIFNDRDESFAVDVMKKTNGRGVDVALNSLAGKLLFATWDCMASFGRFVEIGKK